MDEPQITDVDQEFLGDITKKIAGQKIQDFFLDEQDAVNLLLENGVILKVPLKELWIAIPTDTKILM